MFDENGDLALISDNFFYEMRCKMIEDSWKIVWPLVKTKKFSEIDTKILEARKFH